MPHRPVFQEPAQVFGQLSGVRIPPAGLDLETLANEGVEAIAARALACARR
jgi:hypothetical protein